MIASVAVDVALPHLDRLFDYEIPEKWAADAVVGARVRVRFAGRLVDGYIVDLPESSDAGLKLRPIERVVSSEAVLTAAQIGLIRAVADHYCGVFFDVARLAVPPRHAATEKANQRQWPAPKLPDTQANPLPAGLLAEPTGAGFLTALRAGKAVRAHWLVPSAWLVDGQPGPGLLGLVQAAVATLQGGRRVIIVAPDVADVRRIRDALGAVIGLGAIAELHSELGQSARYRNYLAALRGQASVVIGTRTATFAPMADLGLIALWDDGDDLHAEPHAPYWHARAVAAIRASREQCALLFASHARTAEIQHWLERGWLTSIERPAAQLRRIAPLVRATADSDQALARDPHAQYARLPRIAFETIRTGLASGPVLVQVPRAGYLLALSCQRCRTPVRCQQCGGPVRLQPRAEAPAGRQLSCGWCARIITDWRCPVCRGVELRAPVVGSQRTSEELGRAFPGHRVVASSAERRVEEVGEQPALVVTTPGAEPLAAAGYAAAVLLDAPLLLTRADLRAGEEALRRWLNVVALVRGGAQGGTVCVVGPSEERTIQALVRCDPGGFAARELADRLAAGFPPATRLITIDGAASDVEDFTQLGLDSPAEVLGPVPLPKQAMTTSMAAQADNELVQLMLRAPLTDAAQLTSAVKAVAAGRSARKLAAVRICVDPQELS